MNDVTVQIYSLHMNRRISTSTACQANFPRLLNEKEKENTIIGSDKCRGTIVY